MKGKMASTEVLAIEIWKQLSAPIKAIGVELHRIKVQETENNFENILENNMGYK